MYCQTAKRECSYLDVVREMREDAQRKVTDSDSNNPALAESVAKISGAWIELIDSEPTACAPELCGVVGIVINRTLMRQAEERLKYDPRVS